MFWLQNDFYRACRNEEGEQLRRWKTIDVNNCRIDTESFMISKSLIFKIFTCYDYYQVLKYEFGLLLIEVSLVKLCFLFKGLYNRELFFEFILLLEVVNIIFIQLPV